MRQVGHYRVLDRIGSGGMGMVFAGEDINLGRRVALKFLSAELAGNAQALERFKLEARTASSLNHPNICTIYEVGESDGEYFIAMELIEGEALDKYLARHRLDLQEMLDLGIQMADALDAAHSQGILHRDIKPANMLVTARGQVKILDFGLAKLMADQKREKLVGATAVTVDEHLTSPGSTVGTTAFMSPEQARGKELDARSDLFSLGAVLYQMATGRLPFEGETTAVIFDGILNRAPLAPSELNPEIPPKLEEIIRTALEKDRDLRYQSAAEIRAELKRLKRDTSSGRVTLPSGVAPAAGSATVSASRVSAVQPVAKRKPMGLFVLAAAVVVALAAGAYFWMGRARGFNLQNMKIAQVTDDGNAGPSALSPDGRYIVYVVRDGAQESLWVRQVATGGNVQVLAPDQVHFVAVNFTPDGNYVYFVRSDKSTTNFRYLYQMPVLGGSTKQLYRDVDSVPTFSPDGQEIAFARGVLGSPSTNNVIIARADGSGERVLTTRPALNPGTLPVSWSPDGKNLAISSAEFRDKAARWAVEIVAVSDGATRDLHVFTVPVGALAWLPDGSGMLVTGIDMQNGRGQISFLSYPKGEVSRFTNDLTNYSNCCLQITRDGSALVALQNSVASDVWVANADGSDAKQVTSGEPLGLGLVWVGNKILSAGQRGQWSLMNPDGSGITPLFQDREAHPQMASCPDGKHISYTTYKEGKFQLWSADADGSNPVRLAQEFQVISGQQCTPDSKKLVFGAQEGVWSVPIEGGTPAKLDLPSRQIGYSSDGRLMFYVSQEHVNGVLHMALVVASVDAPATALHKIDVPFGMGQVRFTPDGKSLAYSLTRKGAANIWVQALSGGEPYQLTKFTSGDLFAFAWSAEGKQLALAHGRGKSDVVMISNFR